VFLADEEIRKEFYEYLSNYGRALKLSLSSDKIDEVFSESEIQEYKAKMKFYSNLRASIKIRYHESVDFGKYEKQMQKLLDTFISAEDVHQLTKLVNIFDADFEDEIERIVGDNARADTILSAVSATITEKMDSNPAYYEKLSLRIKEIIQEYKNHRLSDEEKLKNAKDVRNMLLSAEKEESENYPDSIKYNRCARAIFDNISDEFKLLGDKSITVLESVSISFDSIFKEASKKPDWVNNSDVTNQIDGQIEDILWDLEDEYNIKFENLDEIIARVRSIGINNYSK
jgi:type I restriction enzyme R subunit